MPLQSFVACLLIHGISSLQKIEAAYQTLEKHMHILMDEQRQKLSSQGEADDLHQRDVFSLMLRASEAEGKLGMTDQELVGFLRFLRGKPC